MRQQPFPPPLPPQVKEFLLEANWTTATSAKKYTTWNRRQVGRSRVVGSQAQRRARRRLAVSLPATVQLCASAPYNWCVHPSLDRLLALQHKVAENEYTAKKTELRNMKILNMRARGRWAREATCRAGAANGVRLPDLHEQLRRRTSLRCTRTLAPPALCTPLLARSQRLLRL